MKISTSIILFFLPWALLAQNWQNVCSSGVTFYQKNGSLIQAFRIDSTDISYLPDTIFLSYNSIRETTGDCLDTTGGSFLGLKVRKTPIGIFWFYNRLGDSLKIHTTEGAGFAWEFITDPSGNYIEATIIGKILDTICGTTDSAKIITFQAKDKNGNNISHVLNGNYIKLSKHFGLTRMMEIYSAPFSPDMYILIGKSSPPIGMQNLTWNEVYDYEVGDEFHYYDHEWNWIWDLYYYTIKRILVKEEFPELHKIVYTVEYCQRKDVPGPPWHYYSYDTLTQINTFASDTDYIKELPMEFIRYGEAAPLFSRIYPDYIGRQSHKKFFGVYYSYDCWHPPFEYFESYMVTDGLGRTRYEWGEMFENYTSTLVYYKKGTEEWGSPVATNCNTLVPVESPITNFQPKIYIYPNPAKEKITVQIDDFTSGSIMVFSLIDLMGREIFKTPINQSPYHINFNSISNQSSLKTGLYIWKLIGENGTVTGKLILE